MQFPYSGRNIDDFREKEVRTGTQDRGYRYDF